MKPGQSLVYVAFSLIVEERGELERMRRRLGCATVEVLLAELTKIGLHTMRERFEPAPHALNIAARARLTSGRRPRA